MSHDTFIEFIKYKGHTVEIHVMNDPEDPRELDVNLGMMVCFHGRYNLGDTHTLKSPEEFNEWLASEVDPDISKKLDFWETRGYETVLQKNETAVEKIQKNVIERTLQKAVILPLYLFDHSGLTISTQPFG